MDAAAEDLSRQRVEAVIESTSRFVRETFPHVQPEPFRTQSCLYTSTPDHDYVLSGVPGHPRAVLVGGGSGHAFKMAPAIGDCAAALALGTEAPLRLERFQLDRLLHIDAYDEQRHGFRR